MIAFECENCGKPLRVATRLAGKLAKCPGCGHAVRVPISTMPPEEEPAGAAPAEPPQAGDVAPAAPEFGDRQAPCGEGEPPAPAPGTDQPPVPAAPPPQAGGPLDLRAGAAPAEDTTADVLAGALMLATFLIPWVVLPNGVFMSWDVAREAGAAFNMFLVGAWVIGIAVLLVNLSVRGIQRWRWNAGLGALGMVLTLIMLGQFSHADWSTSPLPNSRTVAIVCVLLLVALIVVENLQLRFQANQSLATAGRVVGALVIAAFAAGLVKGVANYSDQPVDLRERSALDLVFLSFWRLAMIAAGVAATRPPTAAVSRLVLTGLYVSLGVLGAYLIVRPPFLFEIGGIALTFLNLIMIVGGLILLACRGFIEAISERIRASRPPPAAAAPGAKTA